MNDLTRRQLGLGALLLAAGCASVPPRPPLIEPGRTGWQVDPGEPSREIVGAVGRLSGAGKGASVGGGSGLAVGLAACTAAGPLLPLCLVTVVPGSLAVGALGGATVGAIMAESAELMDAKQALLRQLPDAAALAGLLEDALRARSGPQGQALRPWRNDQAQDWLLRLRITGLMAVGAGPAHALGMRLAAELLPAGAAGAVHAREFVAQSERSQSSADWLRDGSAAAALSALAAGLVEEVLREFLPRPAAA